MPTHSFGPEDIANLTAAFEAARARLGLTDRKDPLTTAVAKAIIQLAKDGERSGSSASRPPQLAASAFFYGRSHGAVYADCVIPLGAGAPNASKVVIPMRTDGKFIIGFSDQWERNYSLG